MLSVQVNNRVVGQNVDEPRLGSIVVDLLNERLTVRELIALTVEEQVRDLRINRRLDAAQAGRMLDRQYLTNEDIQHQASQGAIRHPSIKDIDPDTEIRKAVRAFQRGAFIIVIDGYQAASLDETISLHLGSKVTFLRLTPLVGG